MSAKNAKTAKDDLRPEYRFDYSKSKPNRFAPGSKSDLTVAVVLDPDVAAVFTDSQAVNEALRTVTRVMRQNAVPRRSRRAR
ncbi:MAG: hypothetical protein KJ067_16195 [Vicinamibacteria bacterium]|nr:hypothetical protein [Vicinamibacteria bacterium]